MLMRTSVLRHSRQRGFTLTGLMVGTVVGMIVVSAATTVYLTTVATNADVLREIKLNQEVRTIMSIMVSDIRRAGYWENIVTATPGKPLDNNPDTDDPDDPDNPFTEAGATNIAIHNGGTCILYSYDASYRAGNTGAVDSTDYFGFRLNGSTIQMLTSGNTTSDCTAGSWEALNDNDTISIDTLTFSTEGSQCLNPADNDRAWQLAAGATVAPCDCTDSSVCANYAAPDSGDLLVGSRQITITIQASHVSDPTATVDHSQQVKVRNDRIIVAP